VAKPSRWASPYAKGNLPKGGLTISEQSMDEANRDLEKLLADDGWKWEGKVATNFNAFCDCAACRRLRGMVKENQRDTKKELRIFQGYWLESNQDYNERSYLERKTRTLAEMGKMGDRTDMNDLGFQSTLLPQACAHFIGGPKNATQEYMPTERLSRTPYIEFAEISDCSSYDSFQYGSGEASRYNRIRYNIIQRLDRKYAESFAPEHEIFICVFVG